MNNSNVKRKMNRRGRVGAGVVFLLAILMAAVGFLIVWGFGFNFFEGIIISLTLLLGYVIILVAAASGKKVVNRGKVRTVEKIVEKPVVKIVEKPVVRYRDRPVLKTQRVMPRPKLYKYVGSTETKVYHNTHSRLARLIRPKNRVYSNSESFFKKKGFKASEHIKDKKKEERQKKARKTASVRKSK